MLLLLLLFIELRTAQNVTEQYGVVVTPETFIPQLLHCLIRAF